MIIAYDLETTPIEVGTPTPLYITAYGEAMRVSLPITSLENFLHILESYFLVSENHGAQFVAWNGNNFDAYLIVQALLLSDQWEIYPFMTATKMLRGLRVVSKMKIRKDQARRKSKLRVQFLDGIAMTGIVGKSLKSFLATFAPEYPKLDFDAENVLFDANNPEHVRYAERDSEGLYHAMMKVQTIINELTGGDLKPTIANLAIRYFMDNRPDVELKTPHADIYDLCHGELKRGGYCWAARQYVGPVWKYDLNQAYAAAMRDEKLPAGEVVVMSTYEPDSPAIYQVRLSRTPLSLIPFYYKEGKHGKFTCGKKVETWITSIEFEHCLHDGWDIQVLDGYGWTDNFNFNETVNDLEKLRTTDTNGPSGPLGTMVKAIGNNAYGKTLELLNGTELLIAKDCPEGWFLFDPFDETMAHVYAREKPAFMKTYHLPQIGVFITAHVRCKVRNAALLNPKGFLYADTDCVVYDSPVSLDVHPSRYGAWKVEAAGVIYTIVGKKIYYGEDGQKKAKGLRTRELSNESYEKWLKGDFPIQKQVQRQNLLKFINGRDMFRLQERKGTDPANSNVYGYDNGKFTPK